MLQTPKKLQYPSSKSKAIGFRHWGLEFPWDLELGIWDLLFRRSQFRENAEIFERRRVASHAFSGSDLLEETAHDFSTARFGERFSETDLKIGRASCRERG